MSGITRDLYPRPRTVQRVEDCYFYHVMEIPGHGLVGSEWDLRGHEDAYLGSVVLDGRRVVEIGPGSGFLTFYMESRGARVTAVELAPDAEWDVVPNVRLDLEQIRVDRQSHMERLRNGFWFAHERFGSATRVHYGSVYELPDLGHFDIAVLSSVLLHLRDPLRAVEQCARIADLVVVTDLYRPDLAGALARFEPLPDSDNWHTWWSLTPELLVRFLSVLGFEQTSVSFHEQRYIEGGQEVGTPMFTVTARRAHAAVVSSSPA